MGVEEARAEHEGGSVSRGPEGGDEGPWGPTEEGGWVVAGGKWDLSQRVYLWQEQAR